MELYEKVESVSNRKDLIAFVKYLRTDLETNRSKWENITIEDYLEAMEGWLTDMESYYSNTNQIMPNQPSWKTIADILYASSMYE